MEILKDAASLVQAGAVGISIVALGIIYKIVTNHNHHTNLVIKDSSDSNRKLAEVLGIHSEVIRSLKDTIERKL